MAPHDVVCNIKDSVAHDTTLNGSCWAQGQRGGPRVKGMGPGSRGWAQGHSFFSNLPCYQRLPWCRTSPLVRTNESYGAEMRYQEG